MAALLRNSDLMRFDVFRLRQRQTHDIYAPVREKRCPNQRGQLLIWRGIDDTTRRAVHARRTEGSGKGAGTDEPQSGRRRRAGGWRSGRGERPPSRRGPRTC